MEITEIPVDTLREFLVKVGKHYKKVPYHNFTHAFSLTHFAYWLLKNHDHEKFLTKDDIIGILISCIGHDLNHPGMSNGYLVKAQDPLAVLYNDQSVLENMHTSMLFQIMQSDDFNVLKDFSPERRKYIRRIIVESILATDMIKHNQICDKLKAMSNFDKENKESRFFLCAVIVHAGDLSNLLYEFDHYLKWGKRITQEFSDQYQAEERLDENEYGEATGFLKYTNELGFYNSQIGFMNFVITPMWELLYDFLKFDKVIMDNLSENKRILQERKEKLS